MSKQFVWLLSPPQKWESGPELIPGKTYNVKDFPSHVVAEWVRSKAAKYAEEVKPKAKTATGKAGG